MSFDSFEFSLVHLFAQVLSSVLSRSPFLQLNLLPNEGAVQFQVLRLDAGLEALRMKIQQVFLDACNIKERLLAYIANVLVSTSLFMIEFMGFTSLT